MVAICSFAGGRERHTPLVAGKSRIEATELWQSAPDGFLKRYPLPLGWLCPRLRPDGQFQPDSKSALRYSRAVNYLHAPAVPRIRGDPEETSALVISQPPAFTQIADSLGTRGCGIEASDKVLSSMRRDVGDLAQPVL